MHRFPAGQIVNAVLLIHGTGGNAHSLLNPIFSDVLFGPGHHLDIKRYFIILPDLIGHVKRREFDTACELVCRTADRMRKESELHGRKTGDNQIHE